MNAESLLPTLRELPIFASLEDDDALALVERCRAARFEAGAALFGQGEYGESIFLLLSGSVRIVCDAPDGVRIEVATLVEGDLLGEMAIIDPAPRAATAIANEETTALIINRLNFEQLTSVGHPAAARILRRTLELLAQRFREMDDRIEDVFEARLNSSPHPRELWAPLTTDHGD